mgnify:CR=1 FL=1
MAAKALADHKLRPGPVEIGIVCQELGRVIAPEPGWAIPQVGLSR